MVTYTIVLNMVFSALTLAEMTILKCLYISKWSKMAMIEDDFLELECEVCIDPEDTENEEFK